LSNSIHLLIVGNSQEHIFKIVEHYRPFHISLFTSRSLEEITLELAEHIRAKGVSVNIIPVDPFSKTSVVEVMKRMTVEYHYLKSKYPDRDIEFFIGLTGGTNLMAIGAGLAAHHMKLKSHYVLRPQYSNDQHEKIIEIDTHMPGNSM